MKDAIKTLVKREDYFHIFIENHLRRYPNERINTLGLAEEIDPLSAIKLFSISNNIKEAVLNDEIEEWMNKILEDLIDTEILLTKANTH